MKTKSKFNRSAQPISNVLTKMLNGMFTVKSKQTALDWFLRISSVVVGHRTNGLVRQNLFFVRFCKSLAARSGVRFLVLYLKASHVLVMQAAGGMKIPSTQKLGVAVARTKGGLPRMIPKIIRNKIRQGDQRAIKLTLTLLSLYRVLEFPGKLKLSTITDPGKDWSGLKPEISRVIGSFWAVNPWIDFSESSLEAKPFLIAKSSSTSAGAGQSFKSTSIHGVLVAAYRWVSGPMHWLENWCISTGNDLFMEYLFQFTEDPVDQSSDPVLGKLGMKHEAAGKVRVFAMVDAWTNWLLKPLHHMLFDHLRRIPQDGTFDQLAPVRRLQNMGKTKFWCYDLSAATDRLPVDLQVMLLSPYLGGERATYWKELLVGRTYWLKPSRKEDPVPLRYAVGQPMGALSSWAMLALTHHFIVQWAAIRAGVIPAYSLAVVQSGGVEGKYWFKDYAVLGDDIVIANGRVAREYLFIMSSIGVEIGLAKSLVSRNGSLEFAKRYFHSGTDCSPVPFKEIFAARGNISSLIQFGEKYSLRLAQLMDIMGWGYRAKSSITSSFQKMSVRIRNLILMCAAPVLMVETLWSFIETTKVGSVETKENWPQALVWYCTYQFNRLADALEAKQRDWVLFAKAMGFEGTEFPDFGLDLDWKKSSFRPRPTPKSNPMEGYVVDPHLYPNAQRVMAMMSMVLYFDEMQKCFAELKDMEKALLSIYDDIMAFSFDPRESFALMELYHLRFSIFEERLSKLSVPSPQEWRASDEEIRLVRNPLLMVQVWKGCNTALRGPLEPSLAARLVNLHLWDSQVVPKVAGNNRVIPYYRKRLDLVAVDKL